MRRALILALCIAFLLALGVVISQAFGAEWVFDVIGPERMLEGLGPLLYFVPLAVLMVLTYLALWAIGRWRGRRRNR
jgi:uncharacterized BrkB/YihY/UPF0761 family membrane protein